MNEPSGISLKEIPSGFCTRLKTEGNQRRNQDLCEPGGASVGEIAGEGGVVKTVSTVQHGRDRAGSYSCKNVLMQTTL